MSSPSTDAIGITDKPWFNRSCSEMSSPSTDCWCYGQVSVPFRGSCSEMQAVTAIATTAERFPSPFGVRVLKSYVRHGEWAFGRVVSVPFRGSCSEIGRRKAETTEGSKFPSPFGVRVLKCAASADDCNTSFAFPSPFGVRVLKLNWKKSRKMVLVLSFRPLSGFVF